MEGPAERGGRGEGAPEGRIRGLAVGILAGGRSRRMGRDKAFLPVAGEPLLLRTCRLLAPLGELTLVAGGPPDRRLPPLGAGITRVTDPGEGPLGGLAGLAEAQSLGLLFLSACDHPLLDPALVRHLVERIGKAELCLPRVGGRLQPLFALYGRPALEKARSLFAGGERSPRKLVEVCRARIIEEDELRAVDPGLLSFLNLNRPEDLERVRREIEQRRG